MSRTEVLVVNKPNKAEKERTQLMAGGDRINYPDGVGTPTADMLVFKCLINSVILTKGAKWLMLLLLLLLLFRYH